MVPNKAEHSIPVVYLITNQVNGKIYVGSAKDFYHRWSRYRSLGRREQRVIARAIRKHGFHQFEFQVLERVDNERDLIAREQHYIDLLQPLVPKGYNVSPTAGSCLGLTPSPSTRKLLSEAHMGKIGHPVVQLNAKTGAFVAEYQSVSAAARAVGIVGSHIQQVCQGEDVTAAGYQWCFTENYDPASYQVRHRQARGGPRGTHRPVVQYDGDGKQLRVWDNPPAAARALGLHPDSIRYACRGKLKTAAGFRWSFVTDSGMIANINARLTREWKEKHGITSN